MAIQKLPPENFTLQQWEDGKKAIEARKQVLIKEYEGKGYKNVKVTYKKSGKTQTANINNPIESAGSKDAIRLNSKPRQFYLRFGYLLEYIKDNILPRIKVGDNHNDNPQIFNIDTDEWETHMYSLPNQISLDPRVCIVGNLNFNSGRGNTQVFPELPFFREIDNGKSKNPNAAYPLNTYLNFEFILECLKPDDRGDVNVFDFISSICTGLNKALGGINNLEPIINEDTNTLQIIDTTPIPGYSSKPSKSYILQIYGYKNTRYSYISNFVRNVDLKTAITPEFATMITIGATAGGYVKGTEATAFSKWNVGLLDRFKEEFTPGNLSSVKKANIVDEAETNYATEFLIGGYKTRYGLTDLEGNFSLNTDAIERNLSVVTEYYKYIIAKAALDHDTSGGTIGFIPFKLNLTLDGISGIKIYNKLEVNTEFLPKVYGKTVDLIVTGVSHNLSGNDWTTQIETTVIPKTGKQSIVQIDTSIIQESVQNVQRAAFQKAVKTPPNDVIQAMKDYGITTPLQKAHFLSQISHESGQFKYREELASGAAYEGRKDLGNTVKGDGVRFKGRGYMQVTGRANYTKYNAYLKSKGITDDIVANPSLVATKYAADVSTWYWAVLGPKYNKKFNEKADTGPTVDVVTKITKWVNGGKNGLEDRKQKFNYYWSVLQKDPNAYT
jgi:putative chitinase